MYLYIYMYTCIYILSTPNACMHVYMYACPPTDTLLPHICAHTIFSFALYLLKSSPSWTRKTTGV